jgi:Protein of unknown function (DUF3467)
MQNKLPDRQGSMRDDAVEGKYANYFQVGHNAFEFVIDFGQLYPDRQQQHVHTRIVTSPPYVKELLKVLKDSVQQYEKQFGTTDRAD